MTETLNITPHLLIEDGTILCGSSNHFGKRPKAKTVVIEKYDPKWAEEIAGKGRGLAAGTYATARDGQLISIGSAFCGVHKPGYGSLTVRPEVVLDLLTSPAALLDYAKRLYENGLDQAEARRIAEQDRWDRRKREEYATVTFTVREGTASGFGMRGEAAWLIEGHSPDRNEPYPMTNVEVSRDGDRLWVSTSDYMNSGPGRGNASWLAALQDALARAAKLQEKG